MVDRVWTGRAAWALALAQHLAQALLLLAALALGGLIAAQAAGLVPWPGLAITWGGAALPQAGIWAEAGLTLLLALFALYLPANLRMAALERSHRRFALDMQDVARAYALAHAGDRAGVFALSGEFDAMRARMEHLRRHPDLAHLEPELLQLAAQMSFETRELARTYSDDKVARARGFLAQRQEEVQALTDRLAVARRICDDLRRWLTDIEAEERLAQAQLKRLEADLKDILPTLGYDFDHGEPAEANVVSLPLRGDPTRPA